MKNRKEEFIYLHIFSIIFLHFGDIKQENEKRGTNETEEYW